MLPSEWMGQFLGKNVHPEVTNFARLLLRAERELEPGFFVFENNAITIIFSSATSDESAGHSRGILSRKLPPAAEFNES
ncbi:hypothetical protein Tco_0418724 [Tanacetum coccineum]